MKKIKFIIKKTFFYNNFIIKYVSRMRKKGGESEKEKKCLNIF